MTDGLPTLDLEHAWSRMATHLDWADRFWVLFVFTDDPRVADELRERAQALLERAGKPLAWRRAERPERIDELVGELVEGPATEITWIDLVRHDDAAGEPGWGKAWERMMLRLNERRELLRRRAPGGGIVFATTLDRIAETPASAPDLWTIRGLTLCVASQAAKVDLAPIEMLATEDWTWRHAVSRDPELARIAVDKARARGDVPGLFVALVVLAEAESGEAALSVAREAAALSSELAASKETVNALRRLGEVFGRQQYDAEAESCFRRAIALGEQVHGSRVHADIAMSLQGLGNVLAHMATYSSSRLDALEQESVEVMREAVEIWRELVNDRPDEFLPSLAGGLHALARRLSALGQYQDAWMRGEEAVEIWRGLVEASPDSVLPELAASYRDLSVLFHKLGRLREALESAQAAVAIWRDLVKGDPDTYNLELATGLRALAVALDAIGRKHDSLDTREEALAIRRTLPLQTPEMLCDLATSLIDLSGGLRAVNYGLDRAIATSREAIAILRPLAGHHSEMHATELARALATLGDCLSRRGDFEAASKAYAEAVVVQRDLSKRRPEVQLHRLAAMCSALGEALLRLGKIDESLAAGREASEILRSSPPSGSARGKFAATLATYADALSRAGRDVESMQASQEAVDIYSGLVKEFPAAFSRNFAAVLGNQALLHDKTGRHQQASGLLAEALRTILPLFIEAPTAHGHIALKCALDLQSLQTKHGVAIPDDLAPIVALMLELHQPGHPKWEDEDFEVPQALVALVRGLPSKPVEPTEQHLEPDPSEGTRAYLLRWAVLIFVVVTILIVVSSLL